MRITYGHVLRNERNSQEFSGNLVKIGLNNDNDIVLNHPSIAPQAAALHLKNGTWELVVLGPTFVQVGNQKLRRGDRLNVQSNQALHIYPFSLQIEIPEQAEATEDVLRKELDLKLSRLVAELHVELLKRMDLLLGDSGKQKESDHRNLENNVEDIFNHIDRVLLSSDEFTNHIAGATIRSKCIEFILENNATNKSAVSKKDYISHLLTTIPEREREIDHVVSKVIIDIKIASVNDISDKLRIIDGQFWKHWEQAVGKLHAGLKKYLCIRYFKKELKDIVFGYGPLEDLLRLPSVNEIMVVDRERIYIEKAGVLENSGRRFISDEVTLNIIGRIVTNIGRRIDKSSPLVDARLADGSRVNAIIPPVSVSGPCLTIRKFPSRKLTVDDLIKKESLTTTVAEFLKAAVLSRKNILVSGGTGSGKTTLLNCLSDFIPDKERVVTIEDTAELQLKKPHVVRLESKPPNVEGEGSIPIRELVKNALRMRPDRIVVGECRGPEALDMLQAMNSGHDGSMTTLHANTAADVVLRLEVLVQQASDLPIASIHRQIASAVDIVVQLQRRRDGRRIISQVTEYVGIDPGNGKVCFRDLFLLEGQDNEQTLAPTGSLPTFMEELLTVGKLQLSTFYT